MASIEHDGFDEMIRRVTEDQEPQYLDRFGKTVAVVVPFEQYQKLIDAYVLQEVRGGRTTLVTPDRREPHPYGNSMF